MVITRDEVIGLVDDLSMLCTGLRGQVVWTVPGGGHA